MHMHTHIHTHARDSSSLSHGVVGDVFYLMWVGGIVDGIGDAGRPMSEGGSMRRIRPDIPFPRCLTNQICAWIPPSHGRPKKNPLPAWIMRRMWYAPLLPTPKSSHPFLSRGGCDSTPFHFSHPQIFPPLPVMWCVGLDHPIFPPGEGGCICEAGRSTAGGIPANFSPRSVTPYDDWPTGTRMEPPNQANPYNRRLTHA